MEREGIDQTVFAEKSPSVKPPDQAESLTHQICDCAAQNLSEYILSFFFFKDKHIYHINLLKEEFYFYNVIV